MRPRPERERRQHWVADNRVDALAGGDFVMQRVHADECRILRRDAAQEEKDREIHQDQDHRRPQQAHIPDAMNRRRVVCVDHPDERGDHQNRIDDPERPVADRAGHRPAYRRGRHQEMPGGKGEGCDQQGQIVCGHVGIVWLFRREAARL